MHRCFATVVAPIIETLNPRTIAEVGAGSGRLTRRVVAARGAASATIHAIDPCPAFDPDDLAPGEERLVLHTAHSLVALPRIGSVDVALLDGDPNWYTVHAELELLAASARDADRPPPVVVVHNVHWPFGRRDGYHDPATIPDEALHPHAAAGLLPTRSEPAPVGLVLVPYVATNEHRKRSGVLTAVEDFAASDADSWHVVDIPGFHGAAILVADSTVAARPAAGGLIGAFEAPTVLRRAARRAEAGRIEALVSTGVPSEHPLAAPERRLAEIESDTQKLEEQLANGLRQHEQHDAAQWRVETLERDLAARDAERREAVVARDEQARAAVDASVRLERAVEDLESARKALAGSVQESSELREAVARKEVELTELQDRARVLGGRAAHLEEALGAAQAEARAAHADALVLDGRLRAMRALDAEIAGHVRAAAASRSWRLGHGLIRAARRLTFRRAVKSDGALEVALRAIERPQLSDGAVIAPSLGSSRPPTEVGSSSPLTERDDGIEDQTVRRP